MTPEQLKAKFPNASGSFLAVNRASKPDVVGAVGGNRGKPSPQPALVKKPQAQPRRQGRVAVICQIISCRNRILDADNSEMGANKALRDAIAASLAIDDRSSDIRFECGQLHTSGPEGTIVRIQWV